MAVWNHRFHEVHRWKTHCSVVGHPMTEQQSSWSFTDELHGTDGFKQPLEGSKGQNYGAYGHPMTEQRSSVSFTDELHGTDGFKQPLEGSKGQNYGAYGHPMTEQPSSLSFTDELHGTDGFKQPLGDLKVKIVVVILVIEWPKNPVVFLPPTSPTLCMDLSQEFLPMLLLKWVKLINSSCPTERGQLPLRWCFKLLRRSFRSRFRKALTLDIAWARERWRSWRNWWKELKAKLVNQKIGNWAVSKNPG